ncbi:MAG: IS110 family transposase [Terriglobia bacterium]
MREKHCIGIDLHRRRFTCCVSLENGRNYLSEWNLEQLPRFVEKLRQMDEVAVGVTGNTRRFYEAVAPHVARVVIVDPNPFHAISHSVKKTDSNDARNLALYLAKGPLLEGETTRRGRQSDPDPGPASEAANCAEGQGEQSTAGTRDRSRQREPIQREGIEVGSGTEGRPKDRGLPLRVEKQLGL